MLLLSHKLISANCGHPVEILLDEDFIPTLSWRIAFEDKTRTLLRKYNFSEEKIRDFLLAILEAYDNIRIHGCQNMFAHVKILINGSFTITFNNVCYSDKEEPGNAANIPAVSKSDIKAHFNSGPLLQAGNGSFGIGFNMMENAFDQVSPVVFRNSLGDKIFTVELVAKFEHPKERSAYMYHVPEAAGASHPFQIFRAEPPRDHLYGDI